MLFRSVCSFSDKPQRFHAPKDFHIDLARLELCNYPESDPKKLKPYEARVYLWR